MREIKVKIWDPKNGMGESINIYDLPRIAQICLSYGEELKNCIFIQYTGLKDKNGKDIYDGDIIKYTHWDKEYVTDIEWDKYSAAGYAPFDSEIGPMNDEVEVIGNIYENSELLEDK